MPDPSAVPLAEPLLEEPRGAHRFGTKTTTALGFLIGLVFATLLRGDVILRAPGAAITTLWGSDDEGEGGGGGGAEENGVVKNWMSEKGFGFIQPKEGGDDLFCHTRSLLDGEGSVEKGDLVTFQKSYNDRKGKHEASEVRLAPDGKGAGMDMIQAGGGGGGSGGGDGGDRKEDQKGTMSRWLSEKGFGFIHPWGGGDEPDIFCHVRGLADGEGSVNEGDHVIYTAQFNNRQGKYQAVDVKVDPNPPAPTEPPPTEEPPPGEAGKGILMRWNTEKGYGFIMPDGGGDDLFCHSTSLKNGDGSVEEGDFVIYETQWNARKQKTEAKQVEKDPNPPVEEEPEQSFSGGPGNHVHHHIHHHVHHHDHNNDDV
jgi:cold shock CspA family protein